MIKKAKIQNGVQIPKFLGITIIKV